MKKALHLAVSVKPVQRMKEITKWFLLMFSFFCCSYFQAQISGDNSLCQGESTTYSVPPSSGTHNWFVVGGTISGPASGVDQINVTWNNSGTGTVSVNTSGNNLQSLNVTVNSKPVPYITPIVPVTCTQLGQNGIKEEFFSASACINACENSSETYYAPLNSGSTYSWSVTGQASYTTNNNQITVIWGPVGSGTISVTETNASGCSATVSKCVSILNSPIASFTTLPAPVSGVVNVCLNQGLNFIDQSQFAVSWNWNFGDGFFSNEQNPIHAFTQPGTYTVVLTVGNGVSAIGDYSIRESEITPIFFGGNISCNCTSTYTMTVVVGPQTGPEITCISTLCGSQSATYSTDANCSQYNWSIQGGTITSTDGNTVNVDWGNGTNGYGYLTLDIGNCAGYCPTPTTAAIPIIPETTTISGDQVVCYGTYHNYSVPAIPGVTFTWSGQGAYVVSGQGSNQVNMFWAPDDYAEGNYYITVNYTNALLGCSGSAEILVHVAPELDLYYANFGQFCEGSSFQTFFGNPITLSNLFDDQPVLGNWDVITPSGQILTNVITNSATFDSFTFNYGSGEYTIVAHPASGVYCNNEVSRTITVNPTPSTPSAIQGPLEICAGSTQTYSAIAPDGDFFNWEITGGTYTTVLGNPITVTWDATGPYNIKVSTTSIFGCQSQALSLPVTVKAPIVAPDLTGVTSICTGGVSTYSYLGGTLPGASYLWSVSPAEMGNIISPADANDVQISWGNTSGIATVTLTVTSECGQTVTSSIDVNVNGFTPDFTLPLACERSEIEFSTSGTYQEWSFGDGSTETSNGTPVQHTYTSSGSYPVSVYVLDANGCEGNISKIIDVKPSPIANITTPDKREYCPGELISNQLEAIVGSGSTYTYEWFEVGNPTSFASVNPTHVDHFGTFYAVVTNEFGCSSNSDSLTIYQIGCGPCPMEAHTVDFVGLTNPGTCNSVTFTFSGSSNIRPVSWYYLQDQGGYAFISNDPNPTYAFDEAGYYWVRMFYRGPNINGVPGDSVDCYIDRQIFLPIVASFYSEYACESNSLVTHLIDQSGYFNAGEISSYNWTLNGSPLSTVQNPDVTLAAGTYTVGLEITSTAYNVTCSVEKEIVVPEAPVAAFTFNASTCPGSAIQFTDASVGDSINSWTWNFGSNIAGSNSQNPTRLFGPSGTYTVTLDISNVYGCTSQATQTFSVGSPENGVITYADDLSLCTGESIVLTAPAGSDWHWSTGETTQSITVSSSGVYSVTLTGTNGCGYTTAAVTVTVFAPANIAIQGENNHCYGEYIQLYANANFVSYMWSVDGPEMDGIYDFTVPSGYYYGGYFNIGTQQVQVTGIDANGCTATSAPLVITIKARPQEPFAQVTSVDFPCEGNLNVIEIVNAEPGVTYTWSNGFVGTTFTTSLPGSYSVTADNGTGCTSASFIPVEIYPAPDASQFMSGCYSFCEEDAPITLNGISGYANTWYLQDGNTVTPIPTVGTNLQVTTSGTYFVQAFNPFTGCSSTSETIEVTIEPSPVVTIDASEITVCIGADVDLTASGADSYEWYVVGSEYNCTEDNFLSNLLGLTNALAQNDELNSEFINTGIGEIPLVGNPDYSPYLPAFEPYISVDQDIVWSINAGTTTYWYIYSSSNYDSYVEMQLATPSGFSYGDIASVQSIVPDPAFVNPDGTNNHFLLTALLDNSTTVTLSGFAYKVISQGFFGQQVPIYFANCSLLSHIGSGASINVSSTETTTYTVVGTNAATGCSGTQSITIQTYDCTNTGTQYCTLTQGFYGNAKGKACATGEKGSVLIQRVLSAPFGPLVVGKPGRSLTITSANTTCLISRLPAGGTPTALPVGNHVFAANCSNAIPLNGQGRFNNVLLGQTITLGLNMRMSSVLGGYVMQSQFTTIAGTAGSDHLCGTPDDVQIAGSEITKNIPPVVITTLVNMYGSPTVANLFDLANKALAGEPTGAATFADINAAVSAINEGFDGCRTLVTNSTSNLMVNDQMQQKANRQSGFKTEISPNPFTESFVVTYDFETNENIELFVTDLFGKVIFETKIDASRNNLTIHLDDVANGMYLVNFKQNNQIIETKRIFKNN